jgi:putative membrane protein
MVELLAPELVMLLAIGGYTLGVVRLRRRGDSWPMSRTLSLSLGVVCVAASVSPPVSDRDDTFWVHVTQHFLLGMTGPALLALSAPVTLALRALPIQPRRALKVVVHSRPARLLLALPTVLLLNIGGMYALYCTNLYSSTEVHPLLHATTHMHVFVAGCLFSWVVIGTDPMPHRLSTATRIGVLIIVGAAHDTLGKLLYGFDLPTGAGSVAQRHAGAQVMYYGGTLIDIVLVAAVMAQWWRVSGRTLERACLRVPETA